MIETKVSQNIEITTLRGEKRCLTAKELFWIDVLKEGYLVQDSNPLNKGIFRWAKNYIIGKGSYNIKIGNVVGSYNNYGYLRIRFKRMQILNHQLSFLSKYGYIPSMIDHEDEIRDNNFWSNLRDVTHSENLQNKKSASKQSVTMVKGVYFHKAANKWTASISIDRRQIYLGLFDDINDAIEARHQGELKYFTHAPSNRDN